LKKGGQKAADGTDISPSAALTEIVLFKHIYPGRRPASLRGLTPPWVLTAFSEPSALTWHTPQKIYLRNSDLFEYSLVSTIDNEQGRSLIILAPGVKTEEIDISVTDGIINLSVNSTYVKFKKDINIPSEYDSNITAKLELGLLFLHLPKKKKVGKKIVVK
jgi:HSP20 family molecular chaperone IbpA